MRKLLPLLFVLLALPALAGEAEIRQMVEGKLPGVKVQSVLPTPLPGVFEVQIATRDGPQILYADAQGGYILTGNLIEAKSGRDLTEERLQKLSIIDFGKLPLDKAVKVQRGNGKRVLAMFTDPYCPFCRRFEKLLLQLDDVAVYVFMYPVIRPDLANHSRSVWCSKDRARAWMELAAGDKPIVPTAAPSCANPIDDIVKLGQSLNVNGTPTLYFSNGERVSGGMQLADLRAKLDQITAQSTKK